MRQLLASKKGAIIYEATTSQNEKIPKYMRPLLASRKDALLYDATTGQRERCHNI